MRASQLWTLRNQLTYALLILAGGLFRVASVCPAQSIPLIANSRLNDIAATTVNRHGQPVILYNPRLCRAAGGHACSFFLKHERAHIALGHLRKPHDVRVAERQADCHAAKRSSSAEIRAASAYFMNGGATRISTHGTGYQRASRIASCKWR